MHLFLHTSAKLLCSDVCYDIRIDCAENRNNIVITIAVCLPSFESMPMMLPAPNGSQFPRMREKTERACTKNETGCMDIIASIELAGARFLKAP